MKKNNKHANAPNIEALIIERRILLDGRNPKRLREVTRIIEYFFWGIVI